VGIVRNLFFYFSLFFFGWKEKIIYLCNVQTILFNSKHKKMKYIRFPKYRRFAVPLHGCNGYAVPEVLCEDGQRASGDRLFYFI